MNAIRNATFVAVAALLAGCAGGPAPAPAPERPRPVRPAPPPVVASPQAETGAEDWRDQPLALGDWSYDSAAGEARYGDFRLRCDSARRQILLSRAGASGPLRLRTTYGERLLPAGAALAAADPILDELAFSRGRFTVEAQGSAPLILPSWPEPARVIGDCRD
ncbi:MAG TPA: hypothetical protein VE053_14240 [Allosphingosinicella sp.]|nr:hypothetical protein [Allosphingosinicella sp.]